MSKLARSFEDTASMNARAARRSFSGRYLAALGHATEPHILFPAVALLLLSAIWGLTLSVIRTDRATARSAAFASARDLFETYEAHVVRALREIDQTLKVVQYAADTKGSSLALSDLRRRTLLPPGLLFTVSLVDARGKIVA